METLFKKVDYDLGHLLNLIRIGSLGLPDLQRPFIWKNSKVRDLFDSMYRGYPVGYLLFWQNDLAPDNRQIGSDLKQKAPILLIVDGQQRLTSLYAVINGIPVIKDGYKSEPIKIAFSPLQEKFEVADPAIRKDSTYIPDISAVWTSDIFALVDSYLGALENSRPLTDEDRRRIKQSIKRLSDLQSYPFTALELSSALDEEQVSNIFVLINSAGKSLNQADFILTLMSVFWDAGRAQLEAFCRAARTPSVNGPSAFNHFIQPDPDHLLRVAIGLAFRRARLKYVYSILRGKNLETETYSDSLRIEQFKALEGAQERVLNLQYWHDFFKILLEAGYRSASMISSQINVLYTYVLYLVGRTEFKVDERTLRRTMARWFFMSSITGRYTNSPESAMEFDLARLRDAKDPAAFVTALERACDEAITSDYWTMQLPTELATSSPRSPSVFAYYAALNLLGARVLFSNRKVAELLDPVTNASRNALERHHLFPKAYLSSLGIKDTRDTNQIANYALLEWGDNAAIADEPPEVYLPRMAMQVGSKDLERMYYWHALPDAWQSLPYSEFLRLRRERIAVVIRDAYQALCGETTSAADGALVPVADVVGGGETSTVEFKSTLRVNLHTGKPDPRIELSSLKTIAGFLNNRGGTLIVGVTDDGQANGLEADQFASEDKMHQHFDNLIRDRIGPQFSMYIHPRFEDIAGKRVFAVECLPARAPAFVKESGAERFYVRTGASTTELLPIQIHEYTRQRFTAQ